ncbi:MAG: hypothetical protein Q9226_001765, partial [Calogaya cf. arnoldii]
MKGGRSVESDYLVGDWKAQSPSVSGDSSDETITAAPTKKWRRSAGNDARSWSPPNNNKQDVEGDNDSEDEGLGQIKDHQVTVLDKPAPDNEDDEELGNPEQDAEA